MKITVTHDDGTTHDITEGVRVLYDQMSSSMDWGSGFLDFEEVQAIRGLGYKCGFAFIDYQRDKCESCGHLVENHRESGDRRCRQDWRTHSEYRVDGEPAPLDPYGHPTSDFYQLPAERRGIETVVDVVGCSCGGYLAAARVGLARQG